MVKIMPRVYEVMPTADYTAKIKSIEDADGQFGPQIKWTFSVLQPLEYADRELCGWTSATLTNKSKALEWVRSALGGQDIDWTTEFDFDDLVGRMVNLTIVVKFKQDGTEFNKIETVRPHRPAKRPNGKPASMPAPKVPDEIFTEVELAQIQTQEQEKHWIDNTTTRVRFWVFARQELGLSDADVHSALGVQSIKEFTGTVDDARAALEEYAKAA